MSNLVDANYRIQRTLVENKNASRNPRGASGHAFNASVSVVIDPSGTNSQFAILWQMLAADRPVHGMIILSQTLL